MIHVGLDAWDLHPVPLNAVKLEMEVALAEEEAAQQALMKSVWEDITRYQVGEP
jgi:hypothetical protein